MDAETLRFWIEVLPCIAVVILLCFIVCYIAYWRQETWEWRAILKQRGEENRILTYHDRIVRRRKRRELRAKYISEYWARHGCEPFSYKVEEYCNAWEINAKNPYWDESEE